MATLKQRLHRKNSSGSYDVIHLETSASSVLMANGNTAEAEIMSKFKYLGVDPHGSLENDTTAVWKELGNGWCYISDKSTINNYPSSTVGIILNHVQGSYVIQSLLTLTTINARYKRAGNSNGWYGEEDKWYKDFGEGSSIPLTCGGLGTDATQFPPYAIVRATSDSEGYPYLWYTATGDGALYATKENGKPVFGTLPVAQGGTGVTSSTANYVFAAPNGSAGAPSFRKLVAADLPTVPMSKGGTGTSVDIVNAPNNAILRRLKTDEYDQVYYTPTKNGALYATAENGALTFGTLPVAQGGTGATSATANYVFAAPNGSNGAPAFRALAAADIPSLASSKITSGSFTVARGGTGRSTLTSGYFLRGNGTNAITMTAPADVLTAIGAAANSNFVKSGSTAAAGLVPAPPTTAGTTKYLREDGTWQVPPDTNTTYTLSSITGTLAVAKGGTGAATATANYVFAAPNGSNGAPAFRKLVAADIPSLAASKITSGTLGVARGGTGNTSVDTTPTSGSTKMCTSGGIYTAINTLKTSVSEGKALVAEAVTDKGVTTASDASFATIAANIADIGSISSRSFVKIKSINVTSANTEIPVTLPQAIGSYLTILCKWNITNVSNTKSEAGYLTVLMSFDPNMNAADGFDMGTMRAGDWDFEVVNYTTTGSGSNALVPILYDPTNDTPCTLTWDGNTGGLTSNTIEVKPLDISALASTTMKIYLSCGIPLKSVSGTVEIWAI